MTTTIPDTVVVSALQSSGPITASGGVTGNVTGNLTGNSAGTHSGPVVGDVTGNTSGLKLAEQILAADGAITILTGAVVITKGSAAAITLAAPTAGTDDEKVMIITSETAFAHVVTCSSNGFNDKGASGTLTFGGAKGDSCLLKARNGRWWVVSTRNVAVA